MLALLRLISLRHLREAPLRSLLTVLGVAVGVATVVGVTAINRSVMTAFRSTVDTIAGKADLTVAAGQAGFDESVLEQVRALEGVKAASAAISAIAPVAGRPGESLFVLGVDFLDDGYFRTYEGADRDLSSLADDLEFLNSTDRMLVSERFAREHGLAVGDSFELVTPTGIQPFFVHGLVRETGPVKAFGGAVGVMFLASAQAAFDRGTRVDRIDVAAADGVDVEDLRVRVGRALGSAFEVERPSRRGGTVEKMVLSFQMGLNLGSGVALLVGVFLVYNTVAIGVVQRRREIGTLRALGATRRALRALFTLEAVVFGLLGTVVGVPFGIAVARGAIRLVSDTMGAIYVQVNARDVDMGGIELLLGISLGVLGSALAAWRPAFNASRVQPLEALRRDLASGAEGQVRRGPLVAGVLSLIAAWPLTLVPPPIENLPVGGYLSIFALLMALTLLSPALLRGLHGVLRPPAQALLGAPGRLAADNFSRVPGRTAVPVSALSIGVAMTIALGGFVGSFQHASQRWIEQSVPADLFLTSSASLGGVRNVPMAPELAGELEKLPHVDVVDRVRVFPHDVLGLRVYILSLTPDIYERRSEPIYLEGRRPTSEERRQGWVTISENLSRRRDLHAGSTFEMQTPTGQRSYRVAGVVSDYTSDQGTIFMDRTNFVAHFQDDRVDTFELYLDDRAHLDEVRREVISRFARDRQLFVLTNSELRDEAKRLIGDAFSVTYAMEAVAILLALLGVVNTLLAAVLDRTREIGLLRAVGAARRHVIRLFVGEAGLMGITAAVLGLVCGSAMGRVITDVVGTQSTGWSFPFRFPTGLAIQMTVAASVCAVVAGLYPARRAASLDVVEALSYE